STPHPACPLFRFPVVVYETILLAASVCCTLCKGTDFVPFLDAHSSASADSC
ncbi:hypothetical protein CSUI_011381, partial [Cystoisospora suis]